MTTRTRKTTAKKTAPRKTPAKKPARAADESGTVVQLRRPLKTRRRTASGPYTAAELTEARAALASAMARLPVPSILWLTQTDGHATARLADDTLLVHTHERAPEFTALLRCPTGGIHTEFVTNDRDLKAARTVTACCNRRHDDTDPGAGGYDWHKAITLGVHPTTQAVKVTPMPEGIHRATASAAETQPLSHDQIAAGLAARAADTAKEHPQP